MTRKCLDLFSGLGGFSAAFADADEWDVTTVEIDPDHDPDMVADVFDLRPSDFDTNFDVILVGHPCTVFTPARNISEGGDPAWDGDDPANDKSRDLVALVFHTGLEGAMFLWLPTFGADIAGLSSTRASLLLSAFVVAYIPGRFVYTLIAGRVPYGPLVVVLEILIVPVFVWTFFLAEGAIVFVGVAVLGVLVSGIFPTLLAFGTQAAPEYSAPINAISTSTASVSIALVPVAMGALADVYSIRTAMWIPLALTVLVAPTVLIARRIDPNI